MNNKAVSAISYHDMVNVGRELDPAWVWPRLQRSRIRMCASETPRRRAISGATSLGGSRPPKLSTPTSLALQSSVGRRSINATSQLWRSTGSNFRGLGRFELVFITDQAVQRPSFNATCASPPGGMYCPSRLRMRDQRETYPAGQLQSWIIDQKPSSPATSARAGEEGGRQFHGSSTRIRAHLPRQHGLVRREGTGW